MARQSISDNDVTAWTRIGGAGAAVQFINGSAHFDLTTWGPAEFRRIGDEVQLRGSVINASTMTTVLLTFAVGWRPFRYVTLPATSGAAGTYLYINVSGQMVAQGYGAGAWLPLDNVRFSVAPATTA
jgi:hypothetical protein